MNTVNEHARIQRFISVLPYPYYTATIRCQIKHMERKMMCLCAWCVCVSGTEVQTYQMRQSCVYFLPSLVVANCWRAWRVCAKLRWTEVVRNHNFPSASSNSKQILSAVVCVSVCVFTRTRETDTERKRVHLRVLTRVSPISWLSPFCSSSGCSTSSRVCQGQCVCVRVCVRWRQRYISKLKPQVMGEVLWHWEGHRGVSGEGLFVYYSDRRGSIRPSPERCTCFCHYALLCSRKCAVFGLF